MKVTTVLTTTLELNETERDLILECLRYRLEVLGTDYNLGQAVQKETLDKINTLGLIIEQLG